MTHHPQRSLVLRSLPSPNACTSLSTRGRAVANKKYAYHRQLRIATSRDFHKSRMPFELSVLAEATMDVHSITVDNDTSVEDIKAVLEVSTSIPHSQLSLLHNGTMLRDGTVASIGIQPADMLVMRRIAPSQQRPKTAASSSRASGSQTAQLASTLAHLLQNVQGSAQAAQQKQEADIQKLYSDCLSDRVLAGRLSDVSDEISNALATRDYAAFKRGVAAHEARERQRKAEEQARVARIMADPMSEEAQALMFQQLQEQQAQRNMMEAMEHNPEAFASVSMLYIDAAVNQVFVRAFVDSGAQTTIMSMACARRCNIGHLIDTRYTGIAKGVGSSKILGRIHMVPMQLGSIFIPISITILEDDSMEFLFGLDNLKRHRCCIDLNSNVLQVGEERIPFLGEADIKELHERFVGSDTPANDKNSRPPPQKPSAPPSASVAPSSAFPRPPPASGVFAASPSAVPVPTVASIPDRSVSAALRANQAWPESSIQTLVDLGFTRDAAIRALTATGGNVEYAAGMLF